MFIIIVRPIGKVKKLFSGYLTISSQTFSDAYENSNSTEYKELASKISKQVSWLCFFGRFLFMFLFVYFINGYFHEVVYWVHKGNFDPFLIFFCIILPCLSAQNNIQSSALAVQVPCGIQCARFQVIKSFYHSWEKMMGSWCERSIRKFTLFIFL